MSCLRWLVCLCVLVLGARAQAQITFSIDFQGPTAGLADGFGLGVITEGDILTTPVPGVPGPNPAVIGPFGAVAPGIEIGAAPFAPGAFPGGLGILPGLMGVVELDALSYGRDGGISLHFSVDDFATGVPGVAPDVASEGALGLTGASADVFMFLGPLVTIPPGAAGGNLAVLDGNGFGIGPPLPGYALIEPGAPTVGVLPDAGDNLDALDMDTTAGDLAGPAIYFSVDSLFPDPLEPPPANAGTAAALGFSGADVLVSMAGGAPAVFIPAAALGLDLGGGNTDDLDALAFHDADSSGSFSPGDAIYYSVRRGSAVIGAFDSFYGVPIEPGDVLTLPTGPGLAPAIFISAEALGLGTARSFSAGPFGSDDLDALDVIGSIPRPVPAGDPSGRTLLAIGLLAAAGVVLGRRRRAVA